MVVGSHQDVSDHEEQKIGMGVPKLGVPQNRWLIREHPIKMDDLGAIKMHDFGVPVFPETTYRKM